MPEQSSLDLIARLVAFDTTTGNSNLPLIAFIEDYLLSHGVPSRRVYGEDTEKANLVATIGPLERPGYILSGHTDVVPVRPENWTTDPFVASLRDGRVYGRGTADMKSFVALVLAKVPRMIASDLQRPLHLAFSYDEEIGCIGVRDIIADMAGWSVRPEACFVGEPTGMQVVIGHKGKRSVRVEVTGRAGHSSLAPEGVNAIEFAAALISKVREIGARLAANSRDTLYDVPHTTAQTGVIQGGRQLNIVPDRCSFEFEFRVIGRDDGDALVEEVLAYARDELEPEMQRIAPEAGFGFEVKVGYDGLDTDPEAPIVALTKVLAGQNDHSKVSFGAEAGLYAGRGGIPSILCGPGSIGQAHKTDEFIELEQLDRCEQFLDRLIAHAAA